MRREHAWRRKDDTLPTNPHPPVTASSEARGLVVADGTIIASRLFDVADAIDLVTAEEMWGRRPDSDAARRKFVSNPAKAVTFGVPPLELPSGPLRLDLDSGAVEGEVSVRLYDFGVARIAVSVPVIGLSWADFTNHLLELGRTLGPQAGTTIWRERLDDIRGVIGPAFLRPSDATLEEDYLIALVRTFDECLNADEIQRRLDLVPLLSGEQRTLSAEARQRILRQRFSYYQNDLVVLTWDRAFIYDPQGASDVIDVLEVANAQLLEMRYYDRLLDAELPRMHGAVAMMQRIHPFTSTRRFANLARRLYTVVAEVTKLREQADNALQVTGDVYLAHVYSAALDVFRVPSMTASVDRKLAIIRDTYEALYEEASAGRTAAMEMAIVILFVVEILVAIFHL